MLTVDDYGAIRRARRDGKSIRQIASEFDHSRNTILTFRRSPAQFPGIFQRAGRGATVARRSSGPGRVGE